MTFSFLCLHSVLFEIYRMAKKKRKNCVRSMHTLTHTFISNVLSHNHNITFPTIKNVKLVYFCFDVVENGIIFIQRIRAPGTSLQLGGSDALGGANESTSGCFFLLGYIKYIAKCT